MNTRAIDLMKVSLMSLMSQGPTLALLALLAVSPTFAQTQSDHGHEATPSATAPVDAWAEGEVRRIDRSTQKVTLRHGEIRSLDMPPMTMVFHVPDPDLLSQLKVGDKIRFVAEQSQGRMVLRRTQPAP